jgi:predicted PP-loop superfamily ATPase
VRARRIHLQNRIKTWVETGENPFRSPVECRQCLFDTRIPNIYISSDGLCNMCRTYRQNFKLEVLAAEVEAFLRTPREHGSEVDAVVAFSGGKDSAVSLLLARRRFDLNVIPVMVQNGFIPEAVVENGRRFCRRMGTELVVLDIEFTSYVRQMMDDGFRNGYPCYKCGELFHAEIQRFCAQHRINRVILGRNWWRWIEPEDRSVRWVQDAASGLNMQFMSLPFALQLTEEEVQELLAVEGWTPIRIHGNSTNCLIPGLVEHTLFQRLGYHPELNLLSREVIAGHMTKESARAQLRDVRDLTPALRAMVTRRIPEPGDEAPPEEYPAKG